MSGFRLFCFKQFFKVHIFCLLMMVVFRLFMNVNLGFTLWLVLVISTLCSGIYLCLKPFKITKDIYAVMAVSSCFSLSIIAQRFLWIALRIDLVNMLYFFLSVLIYTAIVVVVIKLWGRWKGKKIRMKQKVNLVQCLRYFGWGFLVFFFFYQLVLSYLVRPNFLTVLALSISHGNLLLIIWTYFDVRRLYQEKKR